MYACLAVTCHLHFWQNDRDILRATVVTRGWNGYRNKSQHRKSTLEKKILPPFQQGFEPATFQSRVRRSNHWAIPAPEWLDFENSVFVGSLWKRQFPITVGGQGEKAHRVTFRTDRPLTAGTGICHCWAISQLPPPPRLFPLNKSGKGAGGGGGGGGGGGKWPDQHWTRFMSCPLKNGPTSTTMELARAGTGTETKNKKMDKIQTRKRFKRTLIHHDTGGQSAHFRGDPLRQATKRHLTVRRLKTMKNEMTYFLFGWGVVYLSSAFSNSTSPWSHRRERRRRERERVMSEEKKGGRETERRGGDGGGEREGGWGKELESGDREEERWKGEKDRGEGDNYKDNNKGMKERGGRERKGGWSGGGGGEREGRWE